MASFEKVYSIDYDVRKALNALKRLEKLLVSIDVKSRSLFRDTKAFDKAAIAARKLELEKSKISQRADRERVRQHERAERLKLRAEERSAARSERIERDRVRAAQRAEQARVRAAERAETQRIRAAERAEVRNERIERQRARAAERSERARSRSSMRIGGPLAAGVGISGRMVAGVGAILGVAAGVRDVTSEFLDFDQAITSASAKFSRLEPALRPGTEGFKEFAREIRQAGVGTEHSAAAVGRAMDFWAKAGKTAEQSKAVLRTTLDFASANQDASGAMLDVARAGDILSDALGQFNLNASDADTLMTNTARVSDVMSAAANRANVSAEELFEAFKQGGPSMTAVGRDIEEASALLATMANNGIKGSQAGNQLKIALSALNAPSAQQAEIMEKLGVQVKDSQGNFRGLTTIIGELNKATAGMGSGERFETFSRIIGREGSSAFIGLLASGQLELEKLTADLRKASGETQNLADQMRQSATSKMEIFKNRLRDIGYRVIEGVDLFGRLSRGMDAINWDALIAGGGAVVEWLGQLPAVATTAIAGVVSSARTKLPEFEALFRQTFDNISRWWGGLSTGMSAKWDTTIGHLTALGQTLLDSYSMIFEEFTALFYEVVSAFFGGADDIEGRWEATGNELAAQISEAVAVISAVIGTIAQTSAAVFSSMLAVVTTVVANIRSIFGGLFQGILDIAEGNFLRGFARVGIAIANAITLPFRAALSGLIKLVSKIPGAEELANSMGIGLKESAENISKGFELAPEAKMISRAGDIPTRGPRQDVAGFETPFEGFSIPAAFEQPAFEQTNFRPGEEMAAPSPQAYAPEEWEAPVSDFVNNIQASLDARKPGAIELRAAAAAQGEQKTVTNQVTVGPTTVKIEATGASYQDVKRAVDRGIGDIGRNIKRGVEDGLGSIGPSEI